MFYAQSGVPITGLTPLPVDLNGNDRVSDDETFFGSRSTVIERLSVVNNKDIHNLPIEHIHLSVDKKTASPEALAFIRWVENNGLNDLKDFGYLAPAPLLTTKLK
jgi:hypothetical protein